MPSFGFSISLQIQFNPNPNSLQLVVKMPAIQVPSYTAPRQPISSPLFLGNNSKKKCYYFKSNLYQNIY